MTLHIVNRCWQVRLFIARKRREYCWEKDVCAVVGQQQLHKNISQLFIISDSCLLFLTHTNSCPQGAVTGGRGDRCDAGEHLQGDREGRASRRLAGQVR